MKNDEEIKVCEECTFYKGVYHEYGGHDYCTHPSNVKKNLRANPIKKYISTNYLKPNAVLNANNDCRNWSPSILKRITNIKDGLINKLKKGK